MNKLIHIVCPAVPYPASNGDLADTYRQLIQLHHAGYDIILHCFTNGRQEETGHLGPLTSRIYLYERNMGHKGISFLHPYCISSRSDPRLLKNLLLVKCPVIFQGIASTFFLPDLAREQYKIFIRLNGVASAVSRSGMDCEKSVFRKLLAFQETRLTRKWEIAACKQAIVLAGNREDIYLLKDFCQDARIRWMPLMVDPPQVSIEPGNGMYCFYFGDFSNPENEQMARWLFEKIFRNSTIPLVLADTGSEPVPDQPYHHESNVCIIAQPTASALEELIRKAQLVLLPRCHGHGFDNRIVQALASGRHCVVNREMLNATGLDDLVVMANGCDSIKAAVSEYYAKPFTAKDIEARKCGLAENLRTGVPEMVFDELLA